MDALASLASLGGGAVFIGLLAPYAFAAYFFSFWDSRRPESPTADDSQILLKVVLCSLLLVGIAIATSGVITLLHYLLSGAKTGTPEIKKGLAGLIAGALPILAVLFMFLPRTNHQEHDKAVKFMFGFLATAGGTAGFMSFLAIVEALILSAGWQTVAGTASMFVVMTSIAMFALFRLGALSSWTAPVRPAPMPQQHYQGGGGYPPQGGGYPPQGGGYPPQGGGYPPQGGGYPPQGGGGYPPGY